MDISGGGNPYVYINSIDAVHGVANVDIYSNFCMATYVLEVAGAVTTVCIIIEGD
ncbi:hypothetical protein [Clostridium thermobutyricum]|uniref:hypothetical protein n=1 Tax=Clostridium thermobutyricum TaxID=29372 RepID=UPI0018A9A3DC|nr:hypothetical protein [Clostridium thermobutyricum]